MDYLKISFTWGFVYLLLIFIQTSDFQYYPKKLTFEKFYSLLTLFIDSLPRSKNNEFFYETPKLAISKLPLKLLIYLTRRFECSSIWVKNHEEFYLLSSHLLDMLINYIYVSLIRLSIKFIFRVNFLSF